MSAATDKTWELLCRAMPEQVLKSFLGFLLRHPQIPDRLGFHVRPIHFYEPLPDFSSITTEAVMRRHDSKAVAWNLSAQQQWVASLSRFADELAVLRKNDPNHGGFDFANIAFTHLDAAVYYATIRAVKPQGIIEIGSGHSTLIASLAVQKNRTEGHGGRITCIEPYPPSCLSKTAVPIELLKQAVETVSLEIFQQLNAGDILFIDSTHTVKFGCDVLREFLEILPELKPGVLVHVHDIFFPFDYPPDWLRDHRRAWNEQYLLEAFLAYNSEFEILLANHLLGADDPKIFTPLMGFSQTSGDFLHQTGSFWMKRKPRAA
jgi:hypothetical protein